MIAGSTPACATDKDMVENNFRGAGCQPAMEIVNIYRDFGRLATCPRLNRDVICSKILNMRRLGIGEPNCL